MESVVCQTYWDESYRCYQYLALTKDDPMRLWLEKFIKDYPNIGSPKSCLEIGCFPGRHLAILGEAGYELNGVDLTPRVLTDVPIWLREHGYSIGEFYQQDFFAFNPEKKYDVVCSFGFIEHFTNYADVLLRHLQFLKEGGYLIVATPNFSGFFQQLLHKMLDDENLKRHWIPAMNPATWATVIENSGNLVLEAGYLGGFEFWGGEQKRSLLQKKILAGVCRAAKYLNSIVPQGHSSIAPYCGLIAQKR